MQCRIVHLGYIEGVSDRRLCRFTPISWNENVLELRLWLSIRNSFRVDTKGGNINSTDDTGRHASEKQSVDYNMATSSQTHEVDLVIGDVGLDFSSRDAASYLSNDV